MTSENHKIAIQHHKDWNSTIEYQEDELKLSFEIYYPDKYHSGIILFPSQHECISNGINWANERELVKLRIIDWTEKSQHLTFVANQLKLDGSMERSLIYIPYGRDSNGILYFTVFYFEGANSFAFHGYNDNNKGNVIKLPNNQSWNKKTPRWLHDRIDEITNQLYKLAKNNEYINPFKVELVEHKN